MWSATLVLYVPIAQSHISVASFFKSVISWVIFVGVRGRGKIQGSRIGTPGRAYQYKC